MSLRSRASLAVLLALALAIVLVPPWRGFVAAGLARVGHAAGFGEGCLHCHAGVAGLEGPHAPQAIGCAACHLGDARTTQKASAHAGMILVPGNLADAPRTCGREGCHGPVVARVERSIMATMAGVVAKNRRVLGEPAQAGGPLPHVDHLGHGVADSHLRELCVGCHLGQAKGEWGPVNEQSQGGGCNACHLEYGAAAAAALERYVKSPREARGDSPVAHPSLTLNPRNGHCFGCHSRSGRIATSYEGWNEWNGPAPADPRAARWRVLGDGRLFERQLPDVHHERGLECIDCHTATELMGAGVAAADKRGQLRIQCEDCHARSVASVAAEHVDPASARLRASRGWRLGSTQRLGTTGGGEPLVNVVVEADASARLLGKRTGRPHALKPPLAACTQKSHERLACSACHSAWAPRCTTCHTQFDPAGEGFDHAAQQWGRGTWNETAGPFEAALPTLGVLAQARPGGLIDTFVPGMIMTFDRNREAGKPPEVIFRRLYARLFAHTIRRESRSCRSCHNDPLALGFGRGELRLVASGGTGRWRFTPQEKALPQDGLPGDAWTGFLREREGMVSTREDARPFSVDEQWRILRVGACLTCHDGGSAVMARALAGFEAAIEVRGPACVAAVRR